MNIHLFRVVVTKSKHGVNGHQMTHNGAPFGTKPPQERVIVPFVKLTKRQERTDVINTLLLMESVRARTGF
jgi:hypothetical protein